MRTNEEIAAKLIECFNTKDVAGLDPIITDTVKHTAGGTAFNAEIEGRAVFLDYMENKVFAKFININFVPDHITQDLEHSVIGVEWHGNFDLKNGNSFESKGILVLDIIDGKIDWVRDYFDTEKTRNAARG